MCRPFFLFIGARYTNFKRRDHFITFISIVSMSGIALGVMVLITVLSVMNGFTKEIRHRILSITPHITISDAWGEPLKNWREIGKALSQHKEIEAIGPYVDGQAMLTKGKEVRGVMLKGIDPDAIEAVFPLHQALKIGKVTDLQPDQFGVIVGSYLANLLGVSVGDSVTLIVPDVTVSMAGMVPRVKRLKVVGIFEVGYIYDSGFAFLNIHDAAKIFKTQGGVSGVQLRLFDPFSAPRIAKILQEELSFYHVVDWTILNGTYFSAVKMEKTMMFFTLIMILAIAVFNLISTLVMVVTDKRADIGVLRALGASARKIMAIFICQGAIIGFIGTFFGVILGVTLSLNVTDLVAAIERTFRVKFLSADVYFISFLPSDLQHWDVVLIAGCAMVLSLLATLHPAWRAACVQPAEALRHDA